MSEDPKTELKGAFDVAADRVIRGALSDLSRMADMFGVSDEERGPVVIDPFRGSPDYDSRETLIVTITNNGINISPEQAAEITQKMREAHKRQQCGCTHYTVCQTHKKERMLFVEQQALEMASDPELIKGVRWAWRCGDAKRAKTLTEPIRSRIYKNGYMNNSLVSRLMLLMAENGRLPYSVRMVKLSEFRLDSGAKQRFSWDDFVAIASGECVMETGDGGDRILHPGFEVIGDDWCIICNVREEDDWDNHDADVVPRFIDMHISSAEPTTPAVEMITVKARDVKDE